MDEEESRYDLPEGVEKVLMGGGVWGRKSRSRKKNRSVLVDVHKSFLLVVEYSEGVAVLLFSFKPYEKHQYFS